MKELIRDIAYNKNTKNDAINRVKKDSAYTDEIKGLKRTGNRSTIINFNSDLIRLFGSDYFYKADNEQPDTKDMSDL